MSINILPLPRFLLGYVCMTKRLFSKHISYFWFYCVIKKNLQLLSTGSSFLSFVKNWSRESIPLKHVSILYKLIKMISFRKYFYYKFILDLKKYLCIYWIDWLIGEWHTPERQYYNHITARVHRNSTWN